MYYAMHCTILYNISHFSHNVILTTFTCLPGIIESLAGNLPSEHATEARIILMLR